MYRVSQIPEPNLRLVLFRSLAGGPLPAAGNVAGIRVQQQPLGTPPGVQILISVETGNVLIQGPVSIPR